MNNDFVNKVINAYRIVMDLRYNPLRFIPDPVLQGYLLVSLMTMWCGFFGLIAMYWIGWFGYSIAMSIAVHLAIIVPTIITNAVFLDAERKNVSR